MSEPKRPLIVKCLIFNRAGECLMLRRSLDDEAGPGAIDLPGGGVDAGEDIYDAVVREVFEEAGITLSKENIALVCVRSKFQETPNGKRNLHRFLFAVTIDDTNVELSHEHDAFYWYTRRELIANYNHHAWRPMLDYALKYNIV